MPEKILFCSMAEAYHRGGEIETCRELYPGRASPLCHETREQRTAAVWWGAWAGKETRNKLRGGLLYPKSIPFPPCLLHAQSLFVLLSSV